MWRKAQLPGFSHVTLKSRSTLLHTTKFSHDIEDQSNDRDRGTNSLYNDDASTNTVKMERRLVIPLV